MSSMSVGGAPLLVAAASSRFVRSKLKISVSILCEARANNTVINERKIY